jgi:transcription elongation GreA/GreB family factor
MIERFKRENSENCGVCQDVVVGSVVQLEIGEEKEFYLILPAGGGSSFSVEGVGEVTIISPNSALAKAIIGRQTGDKTQFGSTMVALISIH